MSRLRSRVARLPWPLIGALLLALLAVWPALVVSGLHATRAAGDSPFLLQRTYEMGLALTRLQIPPRWMSQSAYGLGYPFWNYYAPLAYLLSGGIALAGGGVVGAVKASQLLTFLLGAWGAFHLARRSWGGPAAGLLGAAAYTFFPYHMVNLYVRGDALSELLAHALFPWLLLAVDRAVSRPSPRSAAALALAFAALPLSHNISALLFAPVVLAYAALRLAPELGRARRGPAGLRGVRPPRAPASEADTESTGRLERAPAAVLRAWERLEWWAWPWPRRLRGPLTAVLAGLALGSVLSAWFWLPALAERGAVQLQGSVTGYFDYHNHFRGLSLLDPRPLFDYGTGGPAGPPTRLGLISTLLAGAGAVAALLAARDAARRRLLLFWAAVAGISLLLITPLSRPLWETVPLLDFAQFPWRWLTVTGLAFAMLTAPLGGALAARLDRPRALWPLTLGASALLALAALPGLRLETLAVDDVSPMDLRVFELVGGATGTTVRNEYLPWSVFPHPVSSVDVVEGREGEPRALEGRLGSAILLREEPGRQTWQVLAEDGQPALLAFPTLWFSETWVAIDGGPPRDAGTIDGSGWTRAEVPAGAHVVDLRLARSLPRALAEGASLAALLVLLALVLVERPARAWRRTLMLAFVAAATVLAARAMPLGAPDGPRTVDTGRTPWPHYNPEGLRFGEALLVEADLQPAGGDDEPSAPRVAAGEGVRLRLAWDPPPDEDRRVEAALVSPAAFRFGVPDVYDREELEPEAVQGLELAPPPTTPPGLYFLRLRVLDPEGEPEPAFSAEGYELGDVFLGPVMVDLPVAAPEPLSEEAVLRTPELRLAEVETEQDGDLLEVRMAWEVLKGPVLDYKTSLRLQGPDGETLVQEDRVPLYGFTPPSSWRAEQQVLDRRWLSLPEDLEAGEDYRIEIVLYDEWTEDEQGKGTVRGVVLEAP